MVSDYIKRKLAEAGKGIAGKIADAAAPIVNKGKEAAYEIAARVEGHSGSSDGVAGTIVGGLQSIVESLSRKIDEKLFTDGAFDSAKAKSLVADKANTVKTFGEKAYAVIEKTVTSGAQTIKNDYRSFVPEPSEIKEGGRYFGIGNKYKGGILFRQNFEDCLAFYAQVNESTMPNSQLKASILEDVKASASATPLELINFYTGFPKDQEHEAHRKISVIQQYLA
jgi:hypothetical protein